MHRNPKNTRNTDDSLCSGTKLLLPSCLLGFQHEERETIFTMLTVPSDPSTRGASRRPNWTRLGSDLNSLRPASNPNSAGLPGPESESQLTAFFQKSPKIFSPSLPGMTSFTSPVLFPIQVFLL